MHLVKIPPAELIFHADRGSGPGGQHKNKKRTRARLIWDFETSSVLSARQKTILRGKLVSRLNESGFLEIVAGEERSQAANRKAALARLEQILRRALTPKKPRIRTGVPHGEKENRISAKKHRSKTKKDRANARFSRDD